MAEKDLGKEMHGHHRTLSIVLLEIPTNVKVAKSCADVFVVNGTGPDIQCKSV